MPVRAGIRVLSGAAMLALAGMATAAPPAPAADPVMAPPGAEAPPAGFGHVLQDLRAIVAARDVQALLAHVTEATTWSFGGDQGHDGFRAMWREGEGLATFWSELDRTLALPGRWDTPEEGPRYCTPYVFCDALPADLDPFDSMVVLGTGVALRARPDIDSRALARLDHVVLRLRPDADEADRWVPVRTAAGLEGYVHADLVRSPVDFRLGIAMDTGRDWWIEYFVAGD